MRPSPAQRLRQHPDDPEVWEYPLSHMRVVFDDTPCRGCPNHTGKKVNCEKLPDGFRCAHNTVWYGEHIEIANKLETP